MHLVPVYLKERNVDFVVVNGENAAGGRGITGKIAIDLLRSGVAVITSGDHIWDQRDTTVLHQHGTALASSDQLSSRCTRAGQHRAGDCQGENRCPQCARPHLYAAHFGQSFPRRYSRGGATSRGDFDNHRRHACRDHQRENCNGAVSRRESFGSHWDPHSRPNGRRADLPRGHSFSLRCGHVRPGQLVSRSRSPADHQEVHGRITRKLSCRCAVPSESAGP